MTETQHTARIVAAEAALDSTRRDRDAAATTVATLAERAERADRTGGDASRAESDLADARATLAQRRAAVDDAHAELTAARAAFHDADVSAFETLDGDQPVALFPVRLETRYGDTRTDEDGTTVRRVKVRVYPDDVHVDTHEERLTDDERAWGEHFWARLWTAAGGTVDPDHAPLGATPSETGSESTTPDGPDRANRMDEGTAFASVRERAWRQLVERYGTARASWVVRALQPPDGEAVLAGPADPTELGVLAADSFPETDRRHDSWTRAPEARALPDHWVALAVEGDDVVAEAVGAPIDRPLAVGPDPTALGVTGDDADAAGDPGDRLSWMTDFDAAVDVGMGIELDLPEASLSAGVDRLVVLGVRGSSDPQRSAAMVRDLFEAHRYTDGLALVDQGTPTNNSRAGSSPATRRDDPVGPAFDALIGGDDAHEEDVVSDGAELARALGLPTGPDEPSPFEEAPGGADTTHGVARQMNACLWAATWGYVVDNLLVPAGWTEAPPADGDPAVASFLEWSDRYREHFVDFVRARGPLATVRVRTQPYGVLPVVAPDAWAPSTTTPLTPSVARDDEYAVTPDTTVVVETGLSQATLELVTYDTERDTVGSLVREVATDAAGAATVDTGSLDGTYRLVDPDDGETPLATIEVAPASPSAFERDLSDRIDGVRSYWGAGTDDVPSLAALDDDGTDPRTVIAEFLGMEATAFGYRVRDVLGPESAAALLEEYVATLVLLGVGGDDVPQGLLDGAFDPDASLRQVLSAFGVDTDARVGRLRFGGVTGEFGDGAPDRLAPLVAESGDAIRAAVEELLSAPLATLRDGPPTATTATTDGGGTADGGDESAATASLLVRLLHHSLLVEYGATRVRLGVEYGGPSVTDAWPERELVDDDGIWQRLDDPIPGDLLSHPALAPAATADQTPTFAEVMDAVRVGDDGLVDPAAPPFAPRLVETVEALRRLRDADVAADPAAMAGILTETLDLAGHRLDAWITSLATRRLYTLRGAQADDEAGLHVGGYGVVESLPTPGEAAGPDGEGFLQAPSMGHATTAAVLRSGWAAHRDGAEGDALAVDLRSHRVREAVRLLDGVEAGHSLGELLGSRFERALHERPPPEDRPDADLEQFVPYFRRLAPLTPGEPPATDDSPTPGPKGEGAGEVVDGLELVSRRRDAAGIEDVLVDAPPDLLAVADLVDEELARLAEAVDAVRDVLTAESVHQLVNGNPERSGASLDALSRGEPAPELDVIETPRTGTSVTNRLLVLFGEGTGGDAVDNGWLDPAAGTAAADREVRAAAEPRLTDWAASMLPDPETVVCTATYRWPGPEASGDGGADGSTDGDSGAGADNDAGPDGTADTDPTVSHTVEATLASLDVSPLDVVYDAIGDDDPAASSLERRFEYVLRRDRPTHADAGTADGAVPADATLELSFDRDPSWSTGRVSVAEFLTAVETLRDLVTAARPADATDLSLPAESRGGAVDTVPSGTGGVERGDLRERANATIRPLRLAAHDLAVAAAATTTSADAPSEEQTPVEHLRSLLDGLAAVEGTVGKHAVKDLAMAMDRLDAAAVRGDLAATLETLARGPVVSLSATAGGDLALRPTADQRVGGATTLPAGTTVDVSLTAADLSVLDVDTEATVTDRGTFSTPVDLSDVPDGTSVRLTVEVPVVDPATATTAPDPQPPKPGTGSVTVRIDGRVDAAVDPTEASLAAVVERDAPAFGVLLGAADTVAAIAATVAGAGDDNRSLATLLETLPAGDLRALAAVLATRDAWADPAVAADLRSLLSLAVDPVPGVSDRPSETTVWTALAAVSRAMVETPRSTRSAIADLADAVGAGLMGSGRLAAPATVERRLRGFLDDCTPGAQRFATATAAAGAGAAVAFDEAVAAGCRDSLHRASYLGVQGCVPVAAVAGHDPATAADALAAQVRGAAPTALARAEAIPASTAAYIAVEATGSGRFDLSGWSVVTADGRTYRFAPGTTVRGGERLTLYTGPGDDTDTDRHWAVGPYGATDGSVALFDAAGRLVSERATDGAPPGVLPNLVEVVDVSLSGGADDDTDGSDVDGSGEETDESVRLENVTDATLDLTGWSVGDRAGHRFRFPDGFELPAGGQVVIHTGRGTDGDDALYWGREAAVWNDAGDVVVVRNAADDAVTRAVYPRLPPIERPTDLSLAAARAAAPGDPTAEFLRFRNEGTAPLDVGGWTVEDRADHTYRFPAETTIAPGAALDLTTGTGTDTATERYWGRDRAVWNDRGDTVIVRDDAGEVVLAAALHDGWAAEEGLDLSVAPVTRGAPSPVAAATYVDQITACLGEGFVVLPEFAPADPAETAAGFAPAHAAQLVGDQTLAAEAWFDRVAAVRDGANRLHRGFAYAGAFAGVPVRDLQAAQFPYDPSDEWIGLPSADPTPGGRVSVVAQVRGQVTETAPLTGLFVDEFVEVVPEATETTGLAFDYDAPGARAPQTVLLAVPPDPDEGWSRETLLATVAEALALADLRLVDAPALPAVGHLLPALMMPTNDGDPPAAPSIDLGGLRSPAPTTEGEQ